MLHFIFHLFTEYLPEISELAININVGNEGEVSRKERVYAKNNINKQISWSRPNLQLWHYLKKLGHIT